MNNKSVLFLAHLNDDLAVPYISGVNSLKLGLLRELLVHVVLRFSSLLHDVEKISEILLNVQYITVLMLSSGFKVLLVYLKKIFRRSAKALSLSFPTQESLQDKECTSCGLFIK